MKDYNSMKHTLLVFNRKETLVDTIIEQDKEIERLNNIINELEKEIKWQRKISLSLNIYGVSVCDILLHKLQELKGSDKE